MQRKSGEKNIDRGTRSVCAWAGVTRWQNSDTFYFSECGLGGGGVGFRGFFFYVSPSNLLHSARPFFGQRSDVFSDGAARAPHTARKYVMSLPTDDSRRNRTFFHGIPILRRGRRYSVWVARQRRSVVRRERFGDVRATRPLSGPRRVPNRRKRGQ